MMELIQKLELNVTLVLSLGSILVMLVGLYQVLAFRRSVPGGVVGKRWNFLTLLVVFFTLGFIFSPFFNLLPNSLLRLFVGIIFFFGSIYVVITINLIHTVIKELTD